MHNQLLQNAHSYTFISSIVYTNFACGHYNCSSELKNSKRVHTQNNVAT